MTTRRCPRGWLCNRLAVDGDRPLNRALVERVGVGFDRRSAALSGSRDEWDRWYYREDIREHPDVYAKGKIADRKFLREFAKHGSEPALAEL